MDGLWGSLKTMPLSDLLLYCVRRGLSGTLRCESGPQEKTVVVRDGHAILTSSNDPREYLGQFLINYGHINEEQLTQAFETQKETNVFLGRILVMIGLVDEPVVRDLVSLKIRETVLSLLSWPHGQFHFADGEGPAAEPGIDVRIPIEEILREFEERKSAWQDIRQVFPDDALYLYIRPEALPDPPAHPLDGRIIELALAGQTIAEIALSLHATPFALHQRLLALHRANCLEPRTAAEMADADESFDIALEAEGEDEVLDLVIEPDPIPETLGEEATVHEIVARAQMFLREGKYGEAQVIASRAVEMAPEDGGARSVLKEAETGLLAELRQRLLGRPLVPRVVASPEALRKLRFTPAERYLLKRFDGKKALAAVLRVSPIKEVEGLKLVDALSGSGVIRLDEPD
jgi:hypothetical protein